MSLIKALLFRNSDAKKSDGLAVMENPSTQKSVIHD